jgi:hypothetical protein
VSSVRADLRGEILCRLDAVANGIVCWEQVGVSGTGSDLVRVPETTSPGDYLLCTATALDESCAVLTVTD